MKFRNCLLLFALFFSVAIGAYAQCKGTGKMIKEVAISTYGSDSKVWCDICKKSFWRSWGHMHVL